jgi:Arc/MetJ-type ribon-helix-helix transcriptional regulator
MDLERISLAIEPELLRRFDRLLGESGVANRSEAVRDLVRKRLVGEDEDPKAESAAALTLVDALRARVPVETRVESTPEGKRYIRKGGRQGRAARDARPGAPSFSVSVCQPYISHDETDSQSRFPASRHAGDLSDRTR